MSRLVSLCVFSMVALVGSLAAQAPARADSIQTNGRIVFVEQDFFTGLRTVYLVDPDGTNLEKLPPWHAEFFQPRWSPDGTEIDMYGDARGVIHQVNCAAVIVNPSPSGDRILFTANAYENHRRAVYLVHPDGTGFHKVSRDCGGRFTNPQSVACGNASWSPDGTRTIFQRAAPNGRRVRTQSMS